MNLELVLILVFIGVVVLALRRLTEQPRPKLPATDSVNATAARPTESQGNLVLITHPLIRRAAQRALAKGGEVTKFLVQEGDRIYFSFDSITDPVERQKALDIMTRIQTGEEANVVELMRFVRRIFRQ